MEQIYLSISRADWDYDEDQIIKKILLEEIQCYCNRQKKCKESCLGLFVNIRKKHQSFGSLSIKVVPIFPDRQL